MTLTYHWAACANGPRWLKRVCPRLLDWCPNKVFFVHGGQTGFWSLRCLQMSIEAPQRVTASGGKFGRLTSEVGKPVAGAEHFRKALESHCSRKYKCMQFVWKVFYVVQVILGLQHLSGLPCVCRCVRYVYCRTLQMFAPVCEQAWALCMQQPTFEMVKLVLHEFSIYPFVNCRGAYYSVCFKTY